MKDLIIYANKNHNTRKTHNDQNMLVYVYGIQNDLVHLNVGESSRLESKSVQLCFMSDSLEFLHPIQEKSKKNGKMVCGYFAQISEPLAYTFHT